MIKNLLQGVVEVFMVDNEARQDLVEGIQMFPFRKEKQMTEKENIKNLIFMLDDKDKQDILEWLQNAAF